MKGKGWEWVRGACEMKRQPDECHKIHLRANRAAFGYGKHFRLAYGSNRREIEEKKKHIKLQQHIENLSVSLLLSHSFSFSDSHPISSCPTFHPNPKQRHILPRFLPTVLPFVCAWLLRDTMAHIWTGLMAEGWHTSSIKTLSSRDGYQCQTRYLVLQLKQGRRFLQNEIKTTQNLCKSSAHNFLQLPKIPSEKVAEVGFSI